MVDIHRCPLFSQKFQDFLREHDFPEVFFMNTFGYTNALRSEQYNHLCEKYLQKKLSDTFEV